MSGADGTRIAFTDRLLADGAVERTYAGGLIERRVPQGPGAIAWADNRGRSGRDLDLGQGRIRREEADGTVAEGQQVGHGITTWQGGRYVTVNETTLPDTLPPPPPRPGGFSGLLIALGLGGLFGLGASAALAYGLDPTSDEYALYAEQMAVEEQRRQLAQAQAGQAGGSNSGTSSSSDYGDSGDTGGGDDRDDWTDDTNDAGGGDFGDDSFG